MFINPDNKQAYLRSYLDINQAQIYIIDVALRIFAGFGLMSSYNSMNCKSAVAV